MSESSLINNKALVQCRASMELPQFTTVPHFPSTRPLQSTENRATPVHHVALPSFPARPRQTTVHQASSREERFRALIQSALELKQKIVAERQRVMTHQQTIVQAEKARRETEAAVKIQAAFRGYWTRKSLPCILSSGRGLAGPPAGSGVGEGEEWGEEGAARRAGVGEKALTRPHDVQVSQFCYLCVCVCVCVCVHTCMRVSKCEHVTCVCMYMHGCTCVYMCVQVCTGV